MAQLGGNIFISVDGSTTPIAGTKSNEIQSSAKTIEVSSPNTADWEEYRKGRKNWSFSVSWILAANTDITGTKLKSLLIVGNTYVIQVCERNGNNVEVILTGSAICTEAKVTSSILNLANGSFSFQGTGPLVDPSEVTEANEEE